MLPLIVASSVRASERRRIFLCVSTAIYRRPGCCCCFYQSQTKLRVNKIKIVHLNLNQIFEMSEDHNYFKDPGRSFRILKTKFNVLSVEQDELNNDIPRSGHGMQGEDKLYLT